MENQLSLENEEDEAPKSSTFSIVCVLLLIGALGFLMYRVATQPRQLAGDVPEHHVAPAGTYFAREYVAWTKPNGVIGLPPGTAVFVRQKNADKWVVNDGIDDLSVSPASLTVDVELAAKLRAHDAESQSRAAASQARAEQIFQQIEMQKRLREQKEMDEARRRIAGGPVGGSTSLDQPAQPQPGGVTSYYSGNTGSYGVPNGPAYYNYQTQQWITGH
jgi:hypothetical protein